MDQIDTTIDFLLDDIEVGIYLKPPLETVEHEERDKDS